MANFQVTLRQQIEAFQKDKSIIGDYAHCSGFYDWFCKDELLAGKAQKLMPKVIKFCKAKGVDLDRHYVWFKNNCFYSSFADNPASTNASLKGFKSAPGSGTLYDDFRIASFETGDNVFTVTPKSGHNGLAEVWGQMNLWNGPIHQAGSWGELASAF